MRSPLKSLRSIPALVFAVATALSILVLPTQLHASSITYSLTFTQTSGNIGDGQGSFIAVGPISNSGQVDTTLTDLTVTIGGDTFTASGPLFVRFLDGKLNDIQFAETLADGATLDISGVYAYYSKAGDSGGTISASVAATPEPGSLILLGTGLLAGAAPLTRRFRLQRS